MDSFTLNKVAGAILLVLVTTMGIGILSDVIFSQEAPEKPGYEIVVASEGEGGAEAAAEPEVEPIAVRLASASADAGEKVAKKCVACHTFDSSNANKVGPGLWEIVGRKPGSHADFGYSAAMTAYGEEKPEWTYENLDNFLAAPKKYISGTSMGFAGLRKPEDRANIIAYLRGQAASPMPLPTE